MEGSGRTEGPLAPSLARPCRSVRTAVAHALGSSGHSGLGPPDPDPATCPQGTASPLPLFPSQVT